MTKKSTSKDTNKPKAVNALSLKDFRKKKNLTQVDFAKSVGVTKQAISAYEVGKKPLSLDTFRKFKSHFGYQSAETGRLRFMIDYLRITFISVRDLNAFTNRFLGIPFREFHSYETKLMMYNHLWKRGDIWIFDYYDKFETGNYQITLQLSGAGCRQMEVVLDYYDVTWVDFLSGLKEHYQSGMQVARLDISVDELYLGPGRESEQLLLDSLIEKYYKKELHFEKMKTWNFIGGGSLTYDKEGSYEEKSNGISIYFGSRSSELYFNFYEKRYELAKKERCSVEEALETFEIWNRFEVRLAHKKANSVVEEYINGVDLAEIARGLINSRLDVFDGTNSYGAYLADKKWQRLFGGTEPLHLTMVPEPYNIRRTINWLRYQVSNSLMLVKKFDELVGEENLDIIINSGEIDERAEKILLEIESNIQYQRGEYDDYEAIA
ncbi:TPA: replication initiation factor domain-containing protein [Streptococcus pyogenes]|nr:replication initiation factor domain-containing protein [Streptococcus pyogenes]